MNVKRRLTRSGWSASGELAVRARAGRDRAPTFAPAASMTVHGVVETRASPSSPRRGGHADGRDLRVAERRARVVVREDPVVRPAVLRVAVGAPLAQAEAVAPAVPAEDERRTEPVLGQRRAAGRRRGRRPQRLRRRPRASRARRSRARTSRRRPAAGRCERPTRVTVAEVPRGPGVLYRTFPYRRLRQRLRCPPWHACPDRHPAAAPLPRRPAASRTAGWARSSVATDEELGREVAVKVLAERYRRGREPARAVQARGARGGAALGQPEHRHDLRRRRARRPADDRDGVPHGRLARRAGHRQAAVPAARRCSTGSRRPRPRSTPRTPPGSSTATSSRGTCCSTSAGT